MTNLFEHFAAGERLYNRILAPVCEKYGLTCMELTVVLFLANNPKFDTAAQIVAMRRLTKSHVSVSCQSLQQKHLLEGRCLPGDRRSVHLSLTPLADPIVADGRKAQDHFASLLMEGFSPQEAAVLRQFIDRIDRNMSGHDPEHFTI